VSTISGQVTTFGSPNFHGELIELTPSETPLLSMAGGLSGGGESTTSTAFEWQTVDLRDAASRPRLEGANAPAAEGRARTNVRNVCQIVQENVETSYTKQAAVGQYNTPGSAPFNSASGAPNPVHDEHSFQVMHSLKQIARDVNWAFWYSTLVEPTTNATARQTKGLLSAIATNVKEKKAKLTAISTATDTLTVTHDLAVDDRFVFTDVGVATAVVPGVAYWVKSISTTASFKISATQGGAAITIGTATQAGYPLKAANTLAVGDANSLLQSVFASGGITQAETSTLFVAPGQKTRLSAAFAVAYGQADPMNRTRTVGGVAVDTIVTDFGTLNIVIDRMAPADAITVVSTEQLAPVFLNIPGKGFLFEEALAKVGSADRSQLYGEIGFKYGNEAAHGTYRGFYPAA
jgi:uncharacterized protein DUF5309